MFFFVVADIFVFLLLGARTALPVFLSSMLFFIFDSRLSLLFSMLVSSRVCVSARLFVSVLWWSWSYLVLVLDLVLILIMILALISWSLGLGLTCGFGFGFGFGLGLGLSSCPLGLGLSVDPCLGLGVLILATCS